MAFVSNVSGEHSGLWPARSPNLSPLDCFLWAFLKILIIATDPVFIDDLKHRITKQIAAIDSRILKNVFFKPHET